MTAADNKTFAYLLLDVTRLLRKHFDRRAAPLGLTRSQWRALKAIDRQPGLSQSDLAELLEMEPIPVGRVVDRLVQGGFVERRSDPKDRRRWCLYRGERAGGVIEQMEVIADRLRADSLLGVSPDEHAALVRVLDAIKGNLLRLESPHTEKPRETP
jgi:DNA-binding MarR family transcriptional regulator